MLITLTDKDQEHCSAVGINNPPALVDIPDSEYQVYLQEWQASTPLPESELQHKIVAHYLHNLRSMMGSPLPPPVANSDASAHLSAFTEQLQVIRHEVGDKIDKIQSELKDTLTSVFSSQTSVIITQLSGAVTKASNEQVRAIGEHSDKEIPNIVKELQDQRNELQEQHKEFIERLDKRWDLVTRTARWAGIILSILLVGLIVATILSPKAHAQFSHIYSIEIDQAGVEQGFFAMPFVFNCTGGLTCSVSNSVVTATVAGAGTVTSVASFSLTGLFTCTVANATTTPSWTCAAASAGAHTFWGNNTGIPAAGAFVQPACGDLSDAASGCSTAALASNAGAVHQFFSAFTAPNSFTLSQPACGDLSNAGTGCTANISIATTYPIGGGTITGTGTLACPTCAIGPSTTVNGSIIAANFANSATEGMKYLGGGAATACSNGTVGLWPVAGFIRNTTVTTSTANGHGALIHANIGIDCENTYHGNSGTAAGSLPGGATVLPGYAAGAYVVANPNSMGHADQGSTLNASWWKQGVTATAANVSNVSAEFVPDSGTWTMFPAAYSNSLSASNNNYIAFGGAVISTSADLIVALPLPVAGTLQYLSFCTTTNSPTNNEVGTLRVNGSNTTVTSTEVASDPAYGCYVDYTHTAAINAGDYFNFDLVTGSTTVSAMGTVNVGFTPSTGSTIIIYGQINETISTTAHYSEPLTIERSATIANEEMGMPRACSVTKLYVVQATANGGGVTTTFTLEKNGSDTALTGTITSVSGTGSISVDSTHTVAYVKGDLMTLKYVTGSGTSGTMGGWALACD